MATFGDADPPDLDSRLNRERGGATAGGRSQSRSENGNGRRGAAAQVGRSESRSENGSPGAAADPAPAGNRCACGGIQPKFRRGVVDIQVKLSTLAELDNDPALIPGFGPVIADIARQVAHDQKRQPDLEMVGHRRQRRAAAPRPHPPPTQRHRRRLRPRPRSHLPRPRLPPPRRHLPDRPPQGVGEGRAVAPGQPRRPLRTPPPLPRPTRAHDHPRWPGPPMDHTQRPQLPHRSRQRHRPHCRRTLALNPPDRHSNVETPRPIARLGPLTVDPTVRHRVAIL